MTPLTRFIEELLDAVPELRALYEEHMADNDSLLPHVFMGDIARFAIANAADPRHRPTLARLLGRLEDGLRAEEEGVRELIRASFVENLLGEHTTVKRLKPLMGFNLYRAVDAVCGG